MSSSIFIGMNPRIALLYTVVIVLLLLTCCYTVLYHSSAVLNCFPAVFLLKISTFHRSEPAYRVTHGEDSSRLRFYQVNLALK